MKKITLERSIWRLLLRLWVFTKHIHLLEYTVTAIFLIAVLYLGSCLFIGCPKAIYNMEKHDEKYGIPTAIPAFEEIQASEELLREFFKAADDESADDESLIRAPTREEYDEMVKVIKEKNDQIPVYKPTLFEGVGLCLGISIALIIFLFLIAFAFGG